MASEISCVDAIAGRLRGLLVSLVVITALLSASQRAAIANEWTKPVAVIEMFSSQACSVSPPANSLFLDFSTDPRLIVLSLNVDYWNYLGWKDTLADPAFTKRQKAYGRARGDRQIYTPQAVINGQVHVVGSDRERILAAIEKAQSESAGPSLSVKLTDLGAKIAVEVARPEAGAKPQAAEIWAFWARRRASILIESGENAGKTVTYHNAVRRAVKIGDLRFDGAGPLLIERFAEARDADALVVVVQAFTPAGPGAILGAAEISLPQMDVAQ